MEDMIRLLAAELGQKPQHVGAVVRLLDEGNTIPFIARYRKEQHGAMDDTTLRTLAERLQYLRNLAQRREEIRRSIAAQEKLTDELDAALHAAVTLSELEDLYRPYKPKRRTRATIARERGLAPLAEQLLGQARDLPDPLTLAAGFADPARGVETPEDALAGASDIVAETVSDDAAVRKALRSLMQRQSVLRTQAAKGKEEETSVYQLYYDFRQPVSRLQGHQILAVNRGEREGFLKVTLETDREQALICVRRCVLVPGGGAAAFLRAACEDAYDRLIAPSMERELRAALTEQANEGAIRNFALNLRPLLMQPPVRGHPQSNVHRAVLRAENDRVKQGVAAQTAEVDQKQLLLRKEVRIAEGLRGRAAGLVRQVQHAVVRAAAQIGADRLQLLLRRDPAAARKERVCLPFDLDGIRLCQVQDGRLCDMRLVHPRVARQLLDRRIVRHEHDIGPVRLRVLLRRGIGPVDGDGLLRQHAERGNKLPALRLWCCLLRRDRRRCTGREEQQDCRKNSG